MFILSFFSLFSDLTFSPPSSPVLLCLFVAGEDDYAIDIFSFGICALEVRETKPQGCFPLCLGVCVRTCVCCHYFWQIICTRRWLCWRSRPTETLQCPRRPLLMQVNPWKTLWWEWVTQIADVTTETRQLAVLNHFLFTLLLYFPIKSPSAPVAECFQ